MRRGGESIAGKFTRRSRTERTDPSPCVLRELCDTKTKKHAKTLAAEVFYPHVCAARSTFTERTRYNVVSVRRFGFDGGSPIRAGAGWVSFPAFVRLFPVFFSKWAKFRASVYAQPQPRSIRLAAAGCNGRYGRFEASLFVLFPRVPRVCADRSRLPAFGRA